MRPRSWSPICNEVWHLCQNRILSGVVGDGFRGERQLDNDMIVKPVHFTVNVENALLFVEIRIGADGQARQSFCIGVISRLYVYDVLIVAHHYQRPSLQSL